MVGDEDSRPTALSETFEVAASTAEVPAETATPQEQLLGPDEEAKYKSKARWRSRFSAIGYMIYSLGIGIAFIAAYYLATNPEAVDLRKWLSSEIVQGMPPELLPLLTPKPDLWAWLGVLGFAILLVYNAFQLLSQWWRWRPMVQRAGRIHDETAVIDAFTTLYRIYVHTRSVGLHGYIWATLGLTTTALFVGRASPYLILMLLILSVLNLACSYLLSNTFKIGEPLVDTLGQIAYRSAHPYDTHHAASKTREIAREHRRKHYWWFF